MERKNPKQIGMANLVALLLPWTQLLLFGKPICNTGVIRGNDTKS